MGKSGKKNGLVFAEGGWLVSIGWLVSVYGIGTAVSAGSFRPGEC